MPFEHACFISFSRGNNKRINNQINEVVQGLKDHLSFEIACLTNDLDVFYDEDFIKGGDSLEESIAYHLCRSICMIVVYMPIYFEKDWCRREYKAMWDLEKRRLNALGEDMHKLIIPLRYRETPDDPYFPLIKDRKYYDFIKEFLIPNPKAMNRRVKYGVALREIANYVIQRHKEFQNFSDDECGIKEGFNLPTDDDVEKWLNQQGIQISKKPTRRERYPFYQPKTREFVYSV